MAASRQSGQDNKERKAQKKTKTGLGTGVSRSDSSISRKVDRRSSSDCWAKARFASPPQNASLPSGGENPDFRENCSRWRRRNRKAPDQTLDCCRLNRSWDD